VNFDDGIILPRGTPARSGVMHSTSSMPRARSQATASCQSRTPRNEVRTGGVGCVPVDFSTGPVEGAGDGLLRVMKHRNALIGAPSYPEIGDWRGGGIDFVRPIENREGLPEGSPTWSANSTPSFLELEPQE